MTKSEFIRAIATDLGVSIARADEIYSAVCSIMMAEAVKPDCIIPFRLVGKLVRTSTAPRRITTPDGKTHDVPSHAKLAFRPTAQLKQHFRDCI